MHVNFEFISGTRRGQVIQVDAEVITIGRDPSCTLAFDPNMDKAVSTRHAELSRGPDGRLVVADMGSRNGTYVDGIPLQEPRSVGPGSTIQFGRTGPMVRVIYRIEIAGRGHQVIGGAPGAVPGAGTMVGGPGGGGGQPPPDNNATYLGGYQPGGAPPGGDANNATFMGGYQPGAPLPPPGGDANNATYLGGPQQGAYGAPPQGYPPQQGYAPAPQGYAPSPQGYAPSPQGYAPQAYAPTPPPGYDPYGGGGAQGGPPMAGYAAPQGYGAPPMAAYGAPPQAGYGGGYPGGGYGGPAAPQPQAPAPPPPPPSTPNDPIVPPRAPPPIAAPSAHPAPSPHGPPGAAPAGAALHAQRGSSASTRAAAAPKKKLKLSSTAWALIAVCGGVTAVSVGVIFAAMTSGGKAPPLPEVIAKADASTAASASAAPPAGPSAKASTGASTSTGASDSTGEGEGTPADPGPAAPTALDRQGAAVLAQQDVLRRGAIGARAASGDPAAAPEAAASAAAPAGASAKGAASGPSTEATTRADWKSVVEAERRRLDAFSDELQKRGKPDLVSLEQRQSQALDALKGKINEAEKRMRDAEARRASDLVARRQEVAALRAERAAAERAQQTVAKRLSALVYVVAESSIQPPGRDPAIPLARAEGTGYIVATSGLVRTTKRIAEPWKFDPRALGILKRLLSSGGKAPLATRYTIYLAGADGSCVALDPPGGVALVASDPDELEDEFREVDIGSRFGGTGREYVRPHTGGDHGGNGAALLQAKGVEGMGLRTFPTSSLLPTLGSPLLAIGLVRAPPPPSTGQAMSLLAAYAPGCAGPEPGAIEEDAAKAKLPPGFEGAPLLVATATDDAAAATCGGPAGVIGLTVIPAAGPPEDAAPGERKVVRCSKSGHELSAFMNPDNCPLCPLPPPTKVEVPVELCDEAKECYAIAEAKVERRLRGTGFHELRAVVVLEALRAPKDAPFPAAVVVHEHKPDGTGDWDEVPSADVSVIAIGRERVPRWPAPDDDRLRTLVAPGVKITVAVSDAHDRDGTFPVKRFLIAPALKVAEAAARLRAKGLR